MYTRNTILTHKGASWQSSALQIEHISCNNAVMWTANCGRHFRSHPPSLARGVVFYSVTKARPESDGTSVSSARHPRVSVDNELHVAEDPTTHQIALRELLWTSALDAQNLVHGRATQHSTHGLVEKYIEETTITARTGRDTVNARFWHPGRKQLEPTCKNRVKSVASTWVRMPIPWTQEQ